MPYGYLKVILDVPVEVFCAGALADKATMSIMHFSGSRCLQSIIVSNNVLIRYKHSPCPSLIALAFI